MRRTIAERRRKKNSTWTTGTNHTTCNANTIVVFSRAKFWSWFLQCRPDYFPCIICIPDFLAPLIIITNTTNLLFSFLLVLLCNHFYYSALKISPQVTVIIHAKSLQSFNHPCNEISFCSLAQNKVKNFTTTFSWKPKNFSSQDRVKINCRIATDTSNLIEDIYWLMLPSSEEKKSESIFDKWPRGMKNDNSYDSKKESSI